MCRIKIYKHRDFFKWANNENISDDLLKQVVFELEQGSFGAKLGRYLYKKRVARIGTGKRGGYRTLIAFRSQDKAIFIYGFAKNVKPNVTWKEKCLVKELANYYLGLTQAQLSQLLKKQRLIEVL